MSVESRESSLVAKFGIIPDLHERLDAAVQFGLRERGLKEGERVDEHLVPGCRSRVWLVAEREHQYLHLRFDTDSALVGGLVGLICDVYQGQPVAAVCDYQTRLVERLGFEPSLSPTRRHGLDRVVDSICRFAQGSDSSK